MSLALSQKLFWSGTNISSSVRPSFFEQSREGFRAFVEPICSYCPLEQCFILMERTGHYHRPLQHYLLELDLPVYVLHVQSREAGMLKTDKRDTLGLANHLYNPNLLTALELRERFPTPNAVATASLAVLRQVRKKSFPSEARLGVLQQLAAQSLGTKDAARQRGLLLEQELLIKELRLIQDHLGRLEGAICQMVEQCRQGKILLSLPPMSPLAEALAACRHWSHRQF